MWRGLGERFSRRQWIFLALAVGAIALTALRYGQFAELEPRMDQASFSVWIQDALESERFWPEAGNGRDFVSTLKGDEDSFLNVLLRRIFVVHDHLFVLASFAWFAGLSLVLGTDFPSQVAISIFSGSLAAAVVAWLPMLGYRLPATPGGTPAAWIAAAIFGFAAASGFLGLFSALGVHNAGLLGLALALVATQKWLWSLQREPATWPPIGAFLAALAVQCLAFYSHYAVVFMLPMATGIALLFMPERPHAANFRTALVYVGGGLITAIPFFVLVLVSQTDIETNQDFLARLTFMTEGHGYTFAAIAGRGQLWVSTLTSYMSPAGFSLGLVGCLYLAWREKAVLPLSLVAVHLFVSLALPGFTQFDRTASYAVLVLFLGAGWLSAALAFEARAAWRDMKRIRSLMIAVMLGAAVLGHAGHEMPRLADPSRVAAWGRTLSPPGSIRTFVADLETRVPENALFFPWDYFANHRIRTLSPRFRAATRHLRPLESFVRESDAGRLRKFVTARGIEMPNDRPIYLLVPVTRAAGLPAMARSVFGPQGLALRTEPVPLAVADMTWHQGGARPIPYGLYVIP